MRPRQTLAERRGIKNARARVLVGKLPAAQVLLADRGYDAGWFRKALKDKGIMPRIPSRKMREVYRFARARAAVVMFWLKTGTSADPGLAKPAP